MLPGDYQSHIDTDRQTYPHADPTLVRMARGNRRSSRVRAAVVLVSVAVLLVLFLWLNSM